MSKQESYFKMKAEWHGWVKAKDVDEAIRKVYDNKDLKKGPHFKVSIEDSHES
jgi:uncharacterized lipoprotein YddW (UPF0748 family)